MCSTNDTLDQHDRALENSDLDMARSKDVFLYAKKMEGSIWAGVIPWRGLYMKSLEKSVTTHKYNFGRKMFFNLSPGCSRDLPSIFGDIGRVWGGQGTYLIQ